MQAIEDDILWRIVLDFQILLFKVNIINVIKPYKLITNQVIVYIINMLDLFMIFKCHARVHI